MPLTQFSKSWTTRRPFRFPFFTLEGSLAHLGVARLGRDSPCINDAYILVWSSKFAQFLYCAGTSSKGRKFGTVMSSTSVEVAKSQISYFQSKTRPDQCYWKLVWIPLTGRICYGLGIWNDCTIWGPLQMSYFGENGCFIVQNLRTKIPA